MPNTCDLQRVPAGSTRTPVASGPLGIRGVSAIFATQSSVSEIMLICVYIDWVSWCTGASGSIVSSTRISGEIVVSSSSGVVVSVWVGASSFKEDGGGLRLSVELPELGDLTAGEEYPLSSKLLP